MHRSPSRFSNVLEASEPQVIMSPEGSEACEGEELRGPNRDYFSVIGVNFHCHNSWSRTPL
jgi:hypothetical protein